MTTTPTKENITMTTYSRAVFDCEFKDPSAPPWPDRDVDICCRPADIVRYDEGGPFSWYCIEHARVVAERLARNGDPAAAHDLLAWIDLADGMTARAKVDA